MSAATTYRLRKHADFQRVYKTGRKRWGQQMAWFSVLRNPESPEAMRSETPGTRVGLTVPKALGKAVDRNRIKRRLREAVRKALHLTGDLPVDIVLHPKRGVLNAEPAALQREVAQIFGTVRSRTSQESASASDTGPGQKPRIGKFSRGSD